MANKQVVLERFRSVCDCALDAAGLVQFDATNPQHIVAVALNGTILEYATGIIGLVDAGNTTAAFVVLRSALEAFVDLSATVDDSQYPFTMQLEQLVQSRRILEEAISNPKGNQYLQALGEHQESKAKLAEFDREIASLESQGVRQLRIRERFELADQLELYLGPYALLCRHSHNNLGVLERRHLKRVDGRVEAEYFQEPALDDIQLIVDTMAGLTANSIACVVSLTTGSNPPSLPAVNASLAELRELWSSWPGA